LKDQGGHQEQDFISYFKVKDETFLTFYILSPTLVRISNVRTFFLSKRKG